jgi:type VI secretion system protein ImpJ
MKDDISVPDLVCWHEGMELLPQHFQMLTLRADAVAARHAQGINPLFWGVRSIMTEVSGNQVRIVDLDAVMPDGLHVRIHRHVDAPLELSTIDLEKAKSQGLTSVYLSVAELYSNNGTQQVQQRFTSQQRKGVPDLSLPKASTSERQDRISVPVWMPNIQLCLQGNGVGTVCMPVLRIQAGAASLTEGPYQPPCPAVTPDSPLGAELQLLLASIRSTCTYQQRIGEKRIEDATLNALWRWLLETEALLQIGISHPSELFVRLVGVLTTLTLLNHHGHRQAPPPPPKYDHQELLDCFAALRLSIIAILKGLDGNYQEVAFIKDDVSGSFVSPVFPPSADSILVAVEVPVQVTIEDAWRWVAAATIASESRRLDLSDQRSVGLNRKQVNANLARQFGKADNVLIFQVELTGRCFVRGEPLYISVACDEPENKLKPLRLSLLTLNQDTSPHVSEARP